MGCGIYKAERGIFPPLPMAICTQNNIVFTKAIKEIEERAKNTIYCRLEMSQHFRQIIGGKTSSKITTLQFIILQNKLLCLTVGQS